MAFPQTTLILCADPRCADPCPCPTCGRTLPPIGSPDPTTYYANCCYAAMDNPTVNSRHRWTADELMIREVAIRADREPA